MAVALTALEDAKENIQPLQGGRSASQLAASLSESRKSSEARLALERAAFLQEIRESEEAEARDEDVDGLDPWQRYIKWTLASYPSGPSHQSQLLPLLEQATRRFSKDARYKSDLRYLRLWILYAKYVDCPRDIFRYLSVNEIGTQLSSMYEEWATAEEAVRNNKEADAVYQLGIARRAEPLSRLKKRRDAFQARMLLPRAREEPAATPEASTSARPVLGGGGLGASQTSKPNGRAFAVFSDSEVAAESTSWEDVGTAASRKQENTVEAKPWVGERMPMPAAAPSMKLTVFRDDDAPLPLPASTRPTDDVFAKSIRGPTEAEKLRRDPFRNYAEPVDLGPNAPPPQPEPIAPTIKRSKPAPASVSTDARKERVALNLAAIYPADEPGAEYTYEELIALRRGLRSKDDARQKELFAAPEWMVEASKSRESFAVDRHGQPVLQDPQTGRLAFAYLRRRAEAELKRKEEAAAEAARVAKEADLQRRRERERLERERAEKERVELERIERERAEAARLEQERVEAARLEAERIELEREQAREQARLEEIARQEEIAHADELSRLSREHTASPTINTKAALAEVNEMFGKTMQFDDQSPCRSDTTVSDDSVDFSLEPESFRPTQSSQQSQPCDFVENSFWGPLASQQSQASQPVATLADEDDETESEPEEEPAVVEERKASRRESIAPQERARANRFAAHIDVMTPLTERTLEYTAHSRVSMASRPSMGVPMLVPEEGESDPELEAIPEGFTIPTAQVPSPHELIDRVGDLTLDVSAYSSETIARVMATYPPSGLLVDLRSSGSRRLSQLQRVAKKKSRRSSARTAEDDDGCFLELGDEVYSVREKLGEGAFAAVFRVASTEADESFDDERNGQFAVKVERPTNVWEGAVLEQVHSRLASSRAARSIVSPQRLYAYSDESYLLLECRDQGTLLDMVNSAASIGIAPQGSTVTAGATGLDESVAMFFVVELMRTVEELHAAGFVHGDLKVDNCLVRLQDVPGGSKAWSAQWQADGSGGWAAKGVTLIDFGRCIDTSAFPTQTRFVSHLAVDPARDCPAVVAGESFVYEPDYWGLAGIAFTLLFGRKLVTQLEDGRVVLERGVMRRYHQTALWLPLFDALLNKDCQIEALRERRLGLEEWLASNSDRVGRPSLRALLKRLEIASLA